MIPDEVLAHWNLTGSIQQLGSGLINDTFLVDQKHVLQRVNSHVFHHPDVLMRNLDAVYDHIDEFIPEFLRGRDDSRGFIDENGQHWRAAAYYESRSFDDLPVDLLSAAGVAFGSFLQRLKGLKVHLEPAIAGFHDLTAYLQQLNDVRRPGEVDSELQFVDGRVLRTELYEIGLQVIHGDCKVNNLLFHPVESRVIRIVDLDTLMWGHPAWDFGDLVRSSFTGNVNEVPATVIERLRSLCAGFFGEFPCDSTDISECETYAHAPAHMSFMLGVRFLADHLAGDRYFRVDRRGQNLDRAREQFRLTKSFDELQTPLVSLIQESSSNA